VIIDCDQCQVRDVACGDCVVSVLLGLASEGEPVEIDAAEARAISVLAGSGLVPPLRLLAPSDRAQHDGPPGRRTYDGGHGAGTTRAG
jgi:hypothetical protein